MKGALTDLITTIRADPKLVKSIEGLKHFIDEIGTLVDRGDTNGVVQKLRDVANAVKVDEALIEKYPFLEGFAKTTETGLQFVASQFEKGAISPQDSSYLVRLLAEQLETILHSINHKE